MSSTDSERKKLETIEPGGLLLNAFKVSFTSDSFTAYRLDFEEGLIWDLRENYDEWFFKRGREGDVIWALPMAEGLEDPFGGNRKTLVTQQRLGLLSNFVIHNLPRLLGEQNIIKRHPLKYVEEESIINSKFKEGWGLNKIVTDGFNVKRVYTFEKRIVNPYDKKAFVVVIPKIESIWEITAALQDLDKKGIDLRGLTIRRRNPGPDESSLLGTIRSIENGDVFLAEQFEAAPESIQADTAKLEGSPKSFKRCLTALMGQERYDQFESALRTAVDTKRTGPALHRYLSELRDRFENKEIQLTPEISCNLGGIVKLKNKNTDKTINRLGKITYYYNTTRTQSHIYPWYGLDSYGPFDSGRIGIREPNILVVCLDSSQGASEQFIKKLRDGVPSKNGYEDGFDGVFDTYNTSFDWCIIEDDSQYNKSPGRTFKNSIKEKFSSLYRSPSEEYDAAIIVVEEDHAFLSGQDNPYLQSKAACLMAGVPTQQVRTSTIKQDEYQLKYTLQNISTALYGKLGGTPWTVDQDPVVSNELVIGLDTAQVQEDRFGEAQRLVGITTVFRGDGNYLLSDVSRKCSYDEYEEVLRESTRRILEQRKREDDWSTDDTIRLVFHSFKRFRNIEIERISAEVAADVVDQQNVEFAFLNISKHHPYYLLDPHEEGDHKHTNKPKGQHMPAAGTVGRLSWPKRLVQTMGPSDVPNPDTPFIQPIMVTLQRAGDLGNIDDFTDLSYLSEQVYKFSGLSWNTVRPVKLPVTMRFSEMIARQLGELEAVPDWSQSALNSQVPKSKWFL